MTVKTVVQLTNKEIPRTPAGDPNFGSLEQILAQFSKNEVVALVNRAIYQAEYQRTSHRERQQRQREQERPIKDKLKQLFPGVSIINATPEQWRKAIEAVNEEQIMKDDTPTGS